MVTNVISETSRSKLAETARRLYEAECALHDAHQSRVDEWIRAAGDRLHAAIVEHVAAVTAERSSSAA